MTTATNGRVIWRYATLGGAPVVVTRHDAEMCVTTDYCGTREQVEDCRWLCGGCGDSSRWHDGYDPVMTEAEAQARANKHAGQCRAMPVTSENTNPSPTLDLTAVCAEIAGVRRELAYLAVAIEKAAEPMAEAARALPDIVSAISDLPDPAEGLADVAMAVECLVPNDPPRWAFWRRRYTHPNLREVQG
jgi:hypothetical protein